MSDRQKIKTPALSHKRDKGRAPPKWEPTGKVAKPDP